MGVENERKFSYENSELKTFSSEYSGLKTFSSGNSESEKKHSALGIQNWKETFSSGNSESEKKHKFGSGNLGLET
ncbi:hypothetical protein C1645_835632 [Glomus cerebriforme]|uniref:Uncharacterized protein n=1 Tax=Glomus cerebriforme TaxID=658196 RepID=A0A397S8G6_9GLOM|nr:hypothetical protein C1645_835632 [Glomus cerebriforme]